MAEPLFEKVAIIGIGLIGSSIARGLRRGGLSSTIVIADRDEHARERAAALGLGDLVLADSGEAAQGADLVIVCTPVGVCGTVAAEVGPHLKPGAILSDVGSVKGAIIRSMGPHVASSVHFVPAHPIAGTEDSGPDAGFAELFDGRWTILTPGPDADEAAVEAVRALWEGLGAKVDVMTPEHHDLVFAIVSHVPHLIAYNIVGTAADLEDVTQSEVIKYSASGFRDFTRIAASDPTMWRDVFLNNRDAVLQMLGRFVEDLTALQRAIRWGEGDKLFELFTRTRAIRRDIIEQGQDTAAPDFGRRGSTKGS
ncbi:prephenate/arogenate dehydrogenase family protein [Hansschlegelia quercus]|uniref:prephenate dehydrogenase n=1 Tax=Hansschlegelia quercus TaxID=2528245 RepID=A0A4Q9GIT4_9HYPH|nr:prephenate/arogenate dehydrogenase family protein [Hansschlegelia quercus]TBN52514.1 prephenate/arogenate dehydrogenase family protein [Hansschlegelia quercus]